MGTSVQEINDYGIPLKKIVVGKPVTSTDASNGYINPSSLGNYMEEAKSSIGWSTGVMGWVWAGTQTGDWINTIYPSEDDEL